jgi:competence protein ComEA
MVKKLLAALLALLALAAHAALDVNKASQAELDGLKGIGPAISGRIVTERNKGSFKDWQDFIDRVKGIGEGNAAKFSAEGLTVNGSTFKGVVVSSPAPSAKKDDKPAAAPMPAKEMSASETKAAAKQAKEEKAEAKKNEAVERKAAKSETAAAKAAKESKGAKPAASTASSASKQ